MLRTKIPMLRKVPVLSGQKVVLMDACELNPGLAEFLHPKPKAKDEAVDCKDHEAAVGNFPSNTTLAEEEDMEDIPSTTLTEAEDVEQSPSTSTNPNGQYISQHQVSQLQELAKEPMSPSTRLLEEKPVEREGRGQFITEHQLTQIMETAEEQERVSKILKSLAQKTKGVLEDIRKKEKKWPQSRQLSTGLIVAVIVALFMAVAVYLLSLWYAQKRVETPVPTWWNYFTSICMRILSFYK